MPRRHRDLRSTRQARLLLEKARRRRTNRPEIEAVEERTLLAASITDISIIEGNPGPIQLSGSLDPGNETDTYRIRANAGQRIFVDAASFSANSGTWYLYDPYSRYVAGTTLGTDFNADLALDGVYTLVLDGNAAPNAPITYSFEITDISDAPVTNTNFGNTYSGNLTAGGIATYTYNASAGTTILFDSLDQDGDSIGFTLKDPSNTTIWSLSASSDTSPLVLSKSGTYTLTITASAAGDYKFRLLDLAANSTPLTFGALNTGTLPDTSIQVFRVDLEPGQRILYDAIDDDFDAVYARLYGPGAYSVPGMDYYYNYSDSDSNPITVTVGGTYYLLQSSQVTASTADYSFRLLDLNRAPSQALVVGATATGTLDPGESAALYRVSLTAGQKIYVDSISPGAGSAYWYLYKPDDSSLTSGGIGYDSYSILTAPVTGEYMLAIFGSYANTAPKDYSIRLLDINVDSTALTFGTAYSGNLADQEAVLYRFNATAGQRVVFDTLDVDYDNTTAILYNPSGNTEAINTNASYDQGWPFLSQTGTYTLVLRSNSGATDYSFRLLDASTPPSVALGTEQSGTLNPGREIDVYRVSLTAGQKIYVDFTSASSTSAYWSLIRPNNDSSIASNSVGNDDYATVPLTGDYLLSIQGNADATLDYKFRVLDLATPATALTLGTTYSGTLTEKSAVLYQFTGTAGQRLLYDAHDADNDQVYVTLYTPSGSVETLNGHNADADTDPFFLSQSGTYTLVINSTVASGNPDYQFRLLDIAAAPQAALGTEYTGTLTPGRASDLYRVTGTAGQTLRIDFRNVSSTSGTWYLYRPDSSSFVTYTNLGGDQIAVNLPVSGTYVLALFGNQAADISYAFQIDDLGTAPAALTLGNEVTQNLPARTSAYYTFNGTAGQRLFYDAIEDDTENVGFLLYDPDYGLIRNVSYNDSDPFTLAKTGRYVVVLTNDTAAAADIRFRLIDTAAAPAQALAFNTPTSNTLNPGKQTAVYRFNATAGQSIYVDFTAGTSGNWYLYRPDNGYMGGTSFGYDGEFDLTQTGEYILVATGNSMASNAFTFQVNPFTYSTTPLTLGTPVTGNIATPGERHNYTFNATAGQRLYFDGQAGPASGTIYARLYTAENAIVGVNTNLLDDSAPFTIVRPGTYRLEIDGNSDTTGSYQFLLSDTATAPTQAVTFGTNYPGTLTPGEATQLYSISGTAGHSLSINSTGANGTWRLYGPGNNQLAAQNLPNDQTVFLPMTGTYLLAVQGNSASPVGYTIQVDDVVPAAVALSGFNTVQSGNLAPSATIDFTFTAPAGRLVYFDSLDRDNDTAQVHLRDPDDQVRFINQNASDDEGPFVLDKPGTYTLRITNTSASVAADYKFRFLDLATAATAYTLGADTSGDLPEFEADVFAFTGAAGQRLVYDARDTDYDAVFARLYRADAANVFINYYSDADNGPFTLDTPGPYYLILSNDSVAATPDYRFALIDFNQSPSSVLPLDGTTVSGTVDPAYSMHTFRFNGTAGQLLYLDFLNTTTSAYWRLYGPNNQGITTLNPSDSMLRLPADGQYLLEIDNDSATTQPYSFRVLQPADGTALTFGTTYTDTLAGQNAKLFTFTGAVGQRLLYDALDNDYDNVSVLLYDPDGSLVHLNSNSDYDDFPFTLTKAGTYTLVQRVNDGTARDYSFRLLDAAQAPAQALTLGTSPIAVTIDPGREIEVFRFNGTAGQNIYLDMLNNAGSVNWYLYRPNNGYESSGNIVTDQLLSLDQTGEYLLVFTGNSATPVTFNFRALGLPTNSTALTLGTTYNGTLADNRAVVYQFNGTAGQVLLYDGQDTDYDAVNFTLYRADGTYVTGTNADDDTNPFRLTTTGVHYLVISSTAAGTPDYQFRLLDANAAPSVALTLDTPVSGTLNPGNAAQIHTFTGTAGQRIYIDFTSAYNSAAYWYLYNPNLGYVTSSTLVGSDRLVDLTQTGTYYLVLFGYYNAATPAPYSFTVYDSPTTTTAYTLGTTQNGAISKPGEYDDYTFTGTKGQRLYFDGQGDSTGTSTVYVQLFDPESQNVVISTWIYNDSNPFTLAKSGTYTLRVYVNSGNDATPSYSFRLIDTAQAPAQALTEGAATSGSLDPGRSTNVYRLSASAGDWFYFDSLLAATSYTGYWTLYNPDNSYATGNYVSFDNSVQLTQTGTYLLALAGHDTTATVPYNFRVSLSQDVPTPLTLGATTLGTLTKPGEHDTYTFAGTAGQQIYLDGLTGPTSGYIYANLYEEDGTYVGLGAYLPGDAGPITLGHTGNYKLVVYGSGDTIGDYGFRLLDLSAQPYHTLNTTIAELTVTLDAALGTTATVDFATANGTATLANNDYLAASGTVTFAPGETSKKIQVIINRDLAPEADETILVNLTNPVGTTIADAQGVITILNDDGPSIFVDNPVVVEGNSGTTTLLFTVSLSANPAVPVSVNYATADGTATAGSDYVATSGTLNFAIGETIKTVAVTVNGDLLAEAHETLFLNLSGAVAALILDNQGVGTIHNDDTAITSSNPSVAEGNSGTTTLTFVVTLTQPVVQTVTVNYATADGTATAGVDYVAKSGTLTFNPGEISKTIEVTVNGDNVLEPNETVLLNFTNASGGTLLTPQATGTILNDDSELSISDAQVVEGDSGTKTMTFTVTLNPTSGATVTVDYTTASGTATAGSDFVTKSGTLTFNPGESSKTIEITINGDTTAEAFETFSVILSNAANATIGDGTGIGTILNDDAAFVVDDLAIAEGSSGTTPAVVSVRLLHPVVQTVSVDVATSDGSATAPGDYAALTATTLTFAPGDTLKTVTVNLVGDTTPEPNETFFVNLSNASTGAVISDPQAIVTIKNDDTTVSIADVAKPEGNSGTSIMTFTVTLSDLSTETVTLNYTTADGSATVAGGDYLASSGTLTFNPGEVSKQIQVTINGDTTPEWFETFTINLSNASNAVLADSQAIGTIQNDDAVLTIGNRTLQEGNAGQTAFDFLVGFTHPVVQTVTVDVATADVTANAGTDYTALPTTTLTFNPGETYKYVTVHVFGDTTPESDETFHVNLSGASGATIGTATGLGTILNDDTVVSVANASVSEGDSGTATMVFTVTLSVPSAETVTVDYSTTNGTATAGFDYNTATGTVTFAPNEVSKTISVTILGDTLDEFDETFNLHLSNPSNATIGTATATGTILDDDDPVSISIADASANEGDSGTQSMTFTVSLSAVSGKTVTVDFSTADGTATAGADYNTASGILTFDPGQISKTITVTILGDTLDEPDETFLVNLSNAGNATLADNQATGTILDDDAGAGLSIANASVAEGHSGTTTMTFIVTLGTPSGQTVTVNYATANGTATAGVDYVATNGTLTFAPNEVAKTITVTINGDTLDEFDETFFVNLSNATNASIDDDQAIGTILDDDAEVSIGVGDATVTEGNSGTVTATFTVSLTAESGKPITVNYATANGTATAGVDYVATSGTLTFAPGEVSKTISVTVNGDTLDEFDETFLVNLSGAVNAGIIDAQGVGTILDDDGPVTVSVAGASVTEGNSGTTTLTFQVTLNAASGKPVSVQYATADGAAIAGEDYLAASGTLTFEPGQTTKTVSVSVLGDTLDEFDEGFVLNLSSPTNANLGVAQATGTILDDDDLVSISVGNATVTEGNSGTVTATFTVSLSAVSGKTVKVDYSTADGTATAGVDYVAQTGTLTFNPGEISKTVSVTINGDTDVEPDETFFLNLVNPLVNASAGDMQGVGTIVNDDAVSNHPPVAHDDEASTTDQAAVTISPLTNDTDLDLPGDTLTIVAVGALPAGTGTLSFTGSTITYTPAPNTHGNVDFTYTIQDAAGLQSTANVRVAVTDITQPKVVDLRVVVGSHTFSVWNTTRTLPWINIQGLEVVFDEDVSVDQADMTLTGVNQPSYGFSSMNYTAANRTARWNLPSAVGVDQLLMVLDGDANTGGVTDRAGNGILNGDLSRALRVLPGDFNGDGAVTIHDSVGIRNQMPQFGGSYSVWADLDFDGDVDVTDINLARARIGKKLP